jgi:hypothetical protein
MTVTLQSDQQLLHVVELDIVARKAREMTR